MGTATIGSTLKYRRGELGIDQADAAARIGMSRTTFSSYERDLQRPSAEVLPALARFLDVTIDEMLVLYGATCIAALRAQLNVPASSHDAPLEESRADSPSVPETESDVPTVETKEPSVSIFSKELSGITTPPVAESVVEVRREAESVVEPRRVAEEPANVVVAKKKKKKKGKKK
jgi:transcriptional regulator with XRE-family HTH domain